MEVEALMHSLHEEDIFEISQIEIVSIFQKVMYFLPICLSGTHGLEFDINP